ncbi:putative glycosyl hydrolase [Clavulina sp. PMI_390]|nr:putative glycosyl hydrolase [Clavulina sp. PMI_390]
MAVISAPWAVTAFATLLLAVQAHALSLTTEQQAGMRVIFSYSGLNPPQSLLDHIANGTAAGVIFFGGNVGSNFSAVVTQLKAANAKSPTGLPLLLMTDQEGGEVRRLSGAPTLSAKQIGASTNPTQAATSAGQGAGTNMLSYGLNVNLAPILGVYRSSGDFLDYYERSFGMTAGLVTNCTSAFIKAQQATGVAATAKHFPGLGAALHTQNTDAGVVNLTMSRSVLSTIDEVPYPTAIADGVKLVMPSWAVYTQVDSMPSGLSTYWLQSELRGRLGFKGVTISDAIEAGALSPYGTYGQRAVLAARAGIDLVLASAQDVTEGEQVLAALVEALTNGQLNTTDAAAAVNRIIALRQSFE